MRIASAANFSDCQIFLLHILIKFSTKTFGFFWIESLKSEKRTLNGSKYRVSPRAFVVTGTNRQQFETDGCSVIDWWREGELRTCRWRARPKRWRQGAAAVAAVAAAVELVAVAAARECLTRKKRACLLYTHSAEPFEHRVQWTFGMCAFWNVPFLKCVCVAWCPFWNVIKMKCGRYGMCPLWNTYAHKGIWTERKVPL